MVYATENEVYEYLGKSPKEINGKLDVTRLIKRASELVDYYATRSVEHRHESYARWAVCAQIEWWIEFGEFNETQFLGHLTISEYSVNIEDVPELAPRARQALTQAGLMTGAVRTQ